MQINQIALFAFLALSPSSLVTMVSAFITPRYYSPMVSLSHTRILSSNVSSNGSCSKFSKIKNPNSLKRSMSSTDSTDSLEADSVYEDIDGIGERTEIVAQKVKNELESVTISPPLVDASIVVEEILANAMVDPEIKAKESSSKTLYETEEIVEAPKLSKIIKFAIPAIGVWMCSPLLSLIDTSSVGLLSGTAQQAALNPAVAVTDYSALLVAFMYTATTNLVAGAKESEKLSVEKPRTSKTLIQSLQLSGFVGLFLGSVLIALAPILLKAIIGNDAIDPEVFSAALKYVRIRALGFPAAVIIGAAQSACLGMQDIKSPMYVLLAAAVVNFFGDLLFVPNSNLWIGGAAGAAWATIFSQYAALALFLKWLQYKPRKEQKTVNLTKAIMELTGKSNEGKPRRKQFQKSLQNLTDTDSIEVSIEEGEGNGVKRYFAITNIFKKKKMLDPATKSNFEESFSTRGFLAGKMRKRELLKFPPLDDAKEFWPYVIPVTTTSVGRVSAYVAMSHVVSSSLGTLSMAANQVILSVFYCLTPIADSLNLTAQSFIPGIFQKKWGLSRAQALKQATVNFMKAGLMVGLTCVGFVGLIPMFSKYFTSDPLVVAQVNSVVPLLAGIFSIHGLICAGEGLLLGHKDLAYLGKAYTGYFLAVPYFMLRCKKMALEGVHNVGLTSLWGVFLCYQVARLIAWGLRLRLLNVRARKDEPVPL
mmetsp:Transcript_8452/g.15941  ORF Transcript_8452/g.15941 Transcript_8452/m.15941 type:complete len:705 (+) Transcript_8452:427-2541(+)